MIQSDRFIGGNYSLSSIGISKSVQFHTSSLPISSPPLASSSPFARYQTDMRGGYLKGSERKVNVRETIPSSALLQKLACALQVRDKSETFVMMSQEKTRIHREETHTVDLVIAYRGLLHKQVGELGPTRGKKEENRVNVCQRI
ncbi:hypothetical protein K435DRAFT_794442 [Dendrothele bispora CBS 962.96]|uniref:Uncharacterized protein n=1 Tax=Dendrothele bispora (strain CBS 962.96) TaxID=1314807 RepID=A0A4S8MDL0_DENBC|nr:hypothetical protein K435DRAFT_794442 [Dendrothele bispora CBS 962.96]